MNASQTVEDLPPGHSLVLNKFNTMRNHALIITKEFQSQEEALTVAGEATVHELKESSRMYDTMLEGTKPKKALITRLLRR